MFSFATEPIFQKVMLCIWKSLVTVLFQ